MIFFFWQTCWLFIYNVLSMHLLVCLSYCSANNFMPKKRTDKTKIKLLIWCGLELGLWTGTVELCFVKWLVLLKTIMGLVKFNNTGVSALFNYWILHLLAYLLSCFLLYSLLAPLLPFLCSELLEVNHIKTIYNIFVALLILLIFNTVVYDYIDTGRLVSVN